MLTDDHIVLRAPEPDDVHTLYRWENDPEVWRVSGSALPYSLHTLMKYVDSINDVYTDHQMRLMIADASSSKLYGAIDLFDCDFRHRRAGVGIMIGEVEDRGDGIGSRALALLLDYAFGTLGFHQLYCQVQVDNLPSLRLFEKFGFVHVGVKKDWSFADGVFRDEVFLQKINKKAGEE